MPLSSAPSINLLAQQFPISFLPPALSTAAQSNKTYCPTLLHLSLCIIFHVSSFPGTQRKHFSIPCPSNNKSVSGLQDMWDICSPPPPKLGQICWAAGSSHCKEDWGRCSSAHVAFGYSVLGESRERVQVSLVSAMTWWDKHLTAQNVSGTCKWSFFAQHTLCATGKWWQ